MPDLVNLIARFEELGGTSTMAGRVVLGSIFLNRLNSITTVLNKVVLFFTVSTYSSLSAEYLLLTSTSLGWD